MITREEARYLVWLARVAHDGRGDILEIGPWLGGSTVCLAAGMRANEQRDPAARLHVLDNFRWREFMSANGSPRAPLPIVAGQSFRPYFESNLRPWADLLEIHEAELPDEEDGFAGHPLASEDNSASALPRFEGRWLTRPVSLAFVDGAKSWKGMVHALREIAPRLSPGALIVFQDYKSLGAYWVPLVVGALGDALALEHVLGNNSVTFRAARHLAEERLARLPAELGELDVGVALGWLAAAGALLREAGDGPGQRLVDLDAAFLLAALGRRAAARTQFRRCQRSWPLKSPPGPLRESAELLEHAIGRPPRTLKGALNAAYHGIARRF